MDRGAGETSAPIFATAIGTGASGVGDARTRKGRRAKTADAMNFIARGLDR